MKTDLQCGRKNMNRVKTNYHTHTNFCDGSDSTETVINSAIGKGFDIIGFSSHTIYPFAELWHIPPREHGKYVSEIRSLAEKHKNKIEVLCGFEVEYIPRMSIPSFSTFSQFSPDYLIGSVHYIFTEGGFFGVDESAENVRAGIDKYFNGNTKSAVCEYFSLERKMLRTGDFTFIGHCDLFRKRNGVLKLFDENESWYREEIALTAKEIARAGVIAEINTGAIARGAMDDLYPSEEMLSLLHENGVPIIINSDAHSTKDLDCAFSRAETAAKKAGYKETAILTKNGGTKISGNVCVKMQPL